MTPEEIDVLAATLARELDDEERDPAPAHGGPETGLRAAGFTTRDQFAAELASVLELDEVQRRRLRAWLQARPG